ncbi:unnamed protein product [Toxocara canis]|uniref:Secreted protein n=1 Tax=Toxocara canis TaxID=6265 RepID=A0A183VCK3_TOXCA|nr:unnamed protein product [Toxocara canis]
MLFSIIRERTIGWCTIRAIMSAVVRDVAVSIRPVKSASVSLLITELWYAYSSKMTYLTYSSRMTLGRVTIIHCDSSTTPFTLLFDSVVWIVFE